MRSLTCAIVFALASPGTAQCTWQLEPTGNGIPGVDQTVACSTVWDPDGAGPQGPLLVLGGDFNVAGPLLASYVVAFDTASALWQSLGSLDSFPRAFVVLPNGTLVAGGGFQSGAEPLMQWNGTAWTPFAGASSLPGQQVVSLAVAANGDLVAVARQYSVPMSAWVSSVHRLVGGAWQTLGTATGPSYPEIFTVLALPNGALVVGGRFQAIQGVAAAGVAMWNGTVWAPLGAGTLGNVAALARLPNGDLVAGGLFAAIGGVAAANVARWDGGAWSPLGAGTGGGMSGGGNVFALRTRTNGELIAAGLFTGAGGSAAYMVAGWDGVAWNALGGGIEYDPSPGSGSVLTLLEAPNGELVAGGGFQTASGRDAPSVARFDGTTWWPLAANGIGNATRAVAWGGNGDVVLGGAFRDIDGIPMHGIARQDGTGWHALGAGVAPLLPTTSAIVNDVLVTPTGDIVVGGDFATAGGVGADAIARWDGSAWHGLGGGMAGGAGPRPVVLAVARAPNGDVIAAGDFATAGGVAADNIARWNGSAWSAFGGGLPGDPVHAVAVLSSGDIVAVRSAQLSSEVLRWDGAAWQTIGLTSTSAFVAGHARALLAMPDGSLVIGGDFARIDFQPFARVARWSAGAWQPLGAGLAAGQVRTLAQLPDGDVIAGGYLPLPGQPDGTLARWDGAAWTPLLGAPLACDRVAVDPRGEFAAAGSFLFAGNVASAYFARAATPCPAAAVPSGAGCAGSNGPNVLAATSLPWIGTAFTATATGVPTSGFAIEAWGLAPVAMRLAGILPQAAPGCALFLLPDVAIVHATTSPILTTSLAIPAAPVLIGQSLLLQVLSLETSPAGTILSASASNRLGATIGAL